MQTSDYFAKRFEELESITSKESIKTINSIEKALTKAQNEINGEIYNWYQRIAVNNGVSYNEAKKLLSAKEMVEFKWDVEDYVKYAKENTVSGLWSEYLENASAQYHITRLESIKIQTQQALEKSFGNQLDLVDKRMRAVYADTYYKSAYEVQKGLNIAFDVSKVSDKKLKLLMDNAWCNDGVNFSSRIWNNKATMLESLHEEMIRTCIKGSSPDEAIKYMTQFVDKKFKNAKVQAGRLVMTEQAYFASMSREQSYADLGVEEYEILATLDSSTSDLCKSMDLKHFPLADFKIGLTAPPFHPWCRTTHVPYFNDEFSVNDKRIARDENGKTYNVENMSYNEWKDKFVVDSPLTTSADSGIISNKEWIGLDQSNKYTKEEAIKTLKGTYGTEFIDSKRYPIDEELLSSCTGWLDSFSNEYGEFSINNPCKMPTIECLPKSKMKNSVGRYTYYPSSTRVKGISLQANYHSDIKVFSKTVEKGVASGHWVANSSIKSTFIHEYGHHVSNSMRWLTNDINWERNFISDCIAEFKNVETTYKGNTYATLGEHVSRYGASDVSELFAEAFCEYYGGEDSRLFARVFGEKLDKVLKGV